MAIVSAATLITSLSLSHLTLAFFFLTSPMVIADQTLVFILGEAMQLPDTRSFETKSPPLAFLAALFLIIGLSDLVAISQPEEIVQVHWGSQAPIRLFLFFILTFYSYAFSPSSPVFTSARYNASSWGEGFKNRIFFTWAFIEMIAWFWVFVTLREERRALILRVQEKRAMEEENL
ncbi:Ilm1p [Blumeria hordei DH14]|uniref:Ilm1p n=1 Tax=Blumeria graminis f. sp. hordei (strain DH14) TaxID=546991 RepID=N1JBJ5_BLUG1|nr:Ilm1p [Blumeria hordei DH14]